MPILRNASTVTQTIPALGVTIPPGATFECPAEIAAELAERPDFERPKAVKKRAPRKAAATRKAAAGKTAAPADDSPKES